MIIHSMWACKTLYIFCNMTDNTFQKTTCMWTQYPNLYLVPSANHQGPIKKKRRGLIFVKFKLHVINPLFDNLFNSVSNIAIGHYPKHHVCGPNINVYCGAPPQPTEGGIKQICGALVSNTAHWYHHLWKFYTLFGDNHALRDVFVTSYVVTLRDSPRKSSLVPTTQGSVSQSCTQKFAPPSSRYNE